MRISARSDYAVRAMLEIAAEAPQLVTSDAIATAQDIPVKFLENILSDLRRAAIVKSKRGAEGGYLLSRPANEITIGQIIRAVDGPIAWVRDERPGSVEYGGNATSLPDVWVAVRSSLRNVVDTVTVAAVLEGKLPKRVVKLTEEPDAWIDP